jgi:uncharacterized protein (DUF488 family)
MEIYTLGTSNRTLEEFLEILKEYKIEAVVDVRHWPTSRIVSLILKKKIWKNF